MLMRFIIPKVIFVFLMSTGLAFAYEPSDLQDKLSRFIKVKGIHLGASFEDVKKIIDHPNVAYAADPRFDEAFIWSRCGKFYPDAPECPKLTYAGINVDAISLEFGGVDASLLWEIKSGKKSMKDMPLEKTFLTKIGLVLKLEKNIKPSYNLDEYKESLAKLRTIVEKKFYPEMCLDPKKEEELGGICTMEKRGILGVGSSTIFGNYRASFTVPRYKIDPNTAVLKKDVVVKDKIRPVFSIFSHSKDKPNGATDIHIQINLEVDDLYDINDFERDLRLLNEAEKTKSILDSSDL